MTESRTTVMSSPASLMQSRTTAGRQSVCPSACLPDDALLTRSL